MSLSLAVMLGAFFGLMLLHAPIGLAMIASGICYFVITRQDLGLPAEQIMNTLFSNYVLLAVPLFIFAANVMNSGAITDRLVDFCHTLMGRFRGGLAHVDVVVSLIFSGMSGSAIADAAGPGAVTIRIMTADKKYTPEFAAAVVVSSATIGPIIPPSIPMVLFSLVSGTSLGALFLGGVLPGLLMTLLLMAIIVLIAHLRGLPAEPPAALHAVVRATIRALPALSLPVVLLAGIYSGVFTPTEAAAVAGLHALILACLVYRAVGISALYRMTLETVRMVAAISLLIAGAFVFNYAIVIERVPADLAAWLGQMQLAPLAFLLVVNLVFLVLGCFLDTTILLLVLVPILLPTVKSLGIDPVHFGIVIIVNMMIGLTTPPYGMLLFVVRAITDAPIGAIVRELLPFFVALLIALLLLILFPAIVLWLPRLAGY
ncbi:MAG: TRAP transporter large permease [Betaproteobacteria bacterium]|nr:TRAP transporter large permease [Betaproteobacteria bacterium]